MTEELQRLQVDEMEVGAVSLVQAGAVPESNGFLVVQMGPDAESPVIDPSDLEGICATYIGVIQSAPEIALRMAAVDSLAVALRTAIAPESAPREVTQSAELADKIAGWDTWQGWQEYVHANVHSPADALKAIDELANLQRSEFVTQEAQPTTQQTEEPPVEQQPENDPVAQAMAAVDQSLEALTQARAALAPQNKLAAGKSPNLREEDTRTLSEMGDNDGDESTEDESDDEGATEDAAGGSLAAATNGDADLALSTRDRLEGHQTIKRTNTVTPPAATEAAHPRTCPTCKLPMLDPSIGQAPGANAVDAHLVNQESYCQGHVEQEAEELLRELEQPVEQGAPALWGGFGETLERTVLQGHILTPAPAIEDAPAPPVQPELPTDPTVLQAALEKAVARITELESRPGRKPASRQSDADATPLTQGKPAGLWDSITPSV